MEKKKSLAGGLITFHKQVGSKDSTTYVADLNKLCEDLNPANKCSYLQVNYVWWAMLFPRSSLLPESLSCMRPIISSMIPWQQQTPSLAIASPFL